MGNHVLLIVLHKYTNDDVEGHIGVCNERIV